MAICKVLAFRLECGLMGRISSFEVLLWKRRGIFFSSVLVFVFVLLRRGYLPFGYVGLHHICRFQTVSIGDQISSIKISFKKQPIIRS